MSRKETFEKKDYDEENLIREEEFYNLELNGL